MVTRRIVTVSKHLLDTVGSGIHAVHTDGRENLIEDLGFKLKGSGELGSGDEAVDVSFGNEGEESCAAILTALFRGSLFLSVMNEGGSSLQ